MSILNRTVFYDFTNGQVRFWDWASVTTTLGSMAEPFLPNDRHGFAQFRNFDPADEIAVINEVRACPVDIQQQTLSGGYHLHGGPLVPRNGR